MSAADRAEGDRVTARPKPTVVDRDGTPAVSRDHGRRYVLALEASEDRKSDVIERAGSAMDRCRGDVQAQS